MVKIYPSILSADFSKLAEEIKEIELSGADGVHIDVMDGHFVNNLTFGAQIVKDIRKCTHLFFDVHLMISNPEKYIEDFVKGGADRITIHTEAVDNIEEVVDMILSYNVKAGISIKPNTEVPQDVELLKKLDSILIMSDEPGFGGQKYIETTDIKISSMNKIKMVNNLNINIAVDGGINFENVNRVIKSGADEIITGSTFFKADDKKDAIKRLKNEVNADNKM